MPATETHRGEKDSRRNCLLKHVNDLLLNDVSHAQASNEDVSLTDNIQYIVEDMRLHSDVGASTLGVESNSHTHIQDVLTKSY